MSKEGYEQSYIKEAFDTNWITSTGNNVNKFEKELAGYVTIKHAVALSSGTAAIHLTLKAIGVGRGDIVICQSLTFVATVNPILYQGAIPVFVDSDKNTWNMNPKALREALRKYPKTKAVLVVHLYGLSADLDKILSICEEYNVLLVEDAAESLGTVYKGSHTGTFGKYGIYSFNGNKIITTSGGGMLVSNDQERVEKVRFWATQSRESVLYYEHKEVGYNYRMSNVLAGIGRGQFRVLDERLAKKRYIYNYYKRALKEIEKVSFMPENDWNAPNYWLVCILLAEPFKPNMVIKALDEANIESRPIWKPMHLQPIFQKYDYIGDHVAQQLFETGVCLPSDTKMTDEDLDRVIEVIKQVFIYE